tara:strand:- start:98 stop:304 length:207 start_codon:yes stop_codon:yes gene_type:complete
MLVFILLLQVYGKVMSNPDIPVPAEGVPAEVVPAVEDIPVPAEVVEVHPNINTFVFQFFIRLHSSLVN